MTDYPYIIADGRIMGSNQDYVQNLIRLATRDNAPRGAWSYEEQEDGSRVWRTIEKLEASNPNAARTLKATAHGLGYIDNHPAEE